MLAVFDRSVAKSPEGLRSPAAAAEGGGGGMHPLLEHFAAAHEGAVTIHLGSSAGAMAFSDEKQNPFLPRLFTVMNDIFCLFQGHIENFTLLKQQYGLGKTANEAIIVIEAYRTLRDRGPFPASQVVRDLNGKFAFVLFDIASKCTFIAAMCKFHASISFASVINTKHIVPRDAEDADGSVPFFWGTDSEDHLVLSDDVEVVKKGCGKSYAPFPKGCFFTTSGGLQSFEHPMNEVKAMPRVDSEGQICGATYKVDVEAKKETGMPRVGSSANWSSQY